ncbi:MAG: NADPH-dependent FMN reductase, partial [Chloroflexota bacterium]
LLTENAALEIAEIGHLPHYNNDIDGEATPEVVEQFKRKISAADAVLIASPEYNHSVPGVLKNAIDWASRRSPGETKTVLDGKPLGIMGVATGAFGTARMQEHLRIIAVAVNMQTVQRPFVLVPFAREKFDEQLRLIDEKTQAFVRDLLANLVLMARTQRTGQPTQTQE